MSLPIRAFTPHRKGVQKTQQVSGVVSDSSREEVKKIKGDTIMLVLGKKNASPPNLLSLYSCLFTSLLFRSTFVKLDTFGHGSTMHKYANRVSPPSYSSSPSRPQASFPQPPHVALTSHFLG